MDKVKTVKFSDYLAEEKKKDPTLSKRLEAESKKLDYAIAVMQLRESLGLTQEEFARKVNKPQSTVARIENGNANPTIKTLEEIAQAVNKTLVFNFI